MPTSTAYSDAATLMFRNRLRIAAYWSGTSEKELLAAIQSGKAGGTTINATAQLVDAAKALNNYILHPTQSNFNPLINSYGLLTPSDQNVINQRLNTALKYNPQVAANYSQNSECRSYLERSLRRR